MQLTVDDLVPPGTYSLSVVGEGGGFSDTTDFVVQVVSAQYNVTLSPRTITLGAGEIGMPLVTVSSLSLPATLSEESIPPPSVVTSFSPNPTSSTSTMTVATGLQAQSGTHKIAVLARFPNGQLARDTLTLTITNPAGWSQVLQSSTMYGIDIDDETQIGVAVGYRNVHRSTDRGRSWIATAPIDTINTYNSVSVKGTRVVAVGYPGAAAISADGGMTWTSGSTGTSRILYGVAFSDFANGVAVGEGVILRTQNGGTSWSVVPVVGDPYVFLDISYVSGSAFAVGLNGVIFRSTNDQNNWTQLASGTTADLWGVSFADASNGVVVGNNGTVLFTSDGGSSWVQRGIPQVTTRFERTYMLNPSIATVGGFGARIYQTFDSGQTWTRDGTSIPFFERMWDIHLSPDNTGVCLVQNAAQGGVSTILLRQRLP
jgi:photosystem II stability/assembly factor-like uncharacterized protein